MLNKPVYSNFGMPLRLIQCEDNMAKTDAELCAIACQVLKDNPYLTLGTSSVNGQPWLAPLMYAVDDADNFYWTSAIDCVHSRDIQDNPRVAIVIFNSNPGYGNAQALYASGTAKPLTGEDLQRGCEVFYTMRYPDPMERAQKGRAPKDFEGSSPRRMYRATMERYSILHPDKHPIYGKLIDHRVEIPFSTAQLRGR